MAPEGIATLPQAPGNQAAGTPDLEAIKQSIEQRMPGSMNEYNQAIGQAISQIKGTPEELQMIMQILQYVLSHEQEYPQIRQKLIEQGQVNPQSIPEEFDRGYLSTMLVLVQEALKRAGGASPMAQGPEAAGFRKGGLAAAAEVLRKKGRGGDSILAHINPQEAAVLKAMGGSGTINPATGIMEFKGGGIGKVFNSIGDAISGVAQSTIGKIVMTVGLGMAIAAFPPLAALGPVASGMIAGALSSGAVSLAGGSNLKDSLRSAAIGGAMGGIAGGVADFAQPAGWLQKGMIGAGLGTAYGVATGQSFPQALRTGAMAGLTAGAMSGFQGDTMSANANAPTPAPVTDNSTPFTPSELNNATAPTPGQQTAPGPLTPNDVSASNIANQGGAQTDFGLRAGPAPTPGNFGQLNYNPTGVSGGISNLSTNVPTTTNLGTNAPTPGGTTTTSPTLSDVGGSLMGGNFSQAGGQAMDWIKANPGMATVGALGITSLAGGFNAPPVNAPGIVNQDETGESYISRNPNQYIVQNLRGVNYNPDGSINWNAGSSGSNYTGMKPVTTTGAAPLPVTNYTAPPSYSVPTNTVSANPGGQVSQPYNVNPYTFYNNIPGYTPVQPLRFNEGGNAMYPRRTGPIAGPGTGTSDSIPAMLSDGEFVLTAKAVKGVGNGSRRQGAKKLYKMMHAMEKKAGGSV